MKRRSKISKTADNQSKKTKRAHRSLIYVDDLTGVYNRRYLKKKQKKIEQFIEKKIPFSIAIIDIDHFKDINDIYGHQKGDEIIKEFARFLKGILRTSDTVIRYGGDEFVCIMPHNIRESAEQIYWRMLDNMKKRKFGGINITISAGISSYPDDGDSFERLLSIADESLYDAKRRGRGRIGLIREKRLEIPTKVFIGRRSEKEFLRTFLTKDGKGARIAAIIGNIGIGKTRLAKEILNNIKGHEILWSDCISLFEEMSYYPIRELIKYKVGRRGKDVLKDIPLAYKIELDKLIPGLIIKKKDSRAEVGLVVDRYRLYESVKTLLDVGKRKKIIVMDNMQWVDRESTEVIKYLVRSFRCEPVTFLIIYRQEEKSAVLEDFRSYISREITVKELELAMFEYNDIKEMLKSIIGENPKEEFLDYIAKGSGGNPFYIEELVKLLSETEYFRVVGDKWVFERPTGEIIPKSIEDITMRKYSDLSNEEKEVLTVATAIGRFDIDLLMAVTGYNEGHIIGTIDRIMKLGFVKPRGDRLEFQEAVSRDAIYRKNIAGLKGQLLHKKIADNLKQLYQGKEHEVLEELAYHYYKGMDRKSGAEYSLEAGDRVKEKYANISAIKYYTWAEELLKDTTEEKKMEMMIDCLLKRANTLSFIGNNKDSLKDLDIGLKYAFDLKDKKKEADVRRGRATIYFTLSRYKDAIDEATKSLKIYKKIDDKDGVANILIIIGNAYCNLNEFTKALELYGEAQKISKLTKNANVESRTLSNQSVVYSDIGDYKKAIESTEKALKITRRIGDRIGTLKTLNNLATTYMRLGGFENALKIYDDAAEINKEVGSKALEATILHNIGHVNLIRGEYDSALRKLEDSADKYRTIGDRHSEAIAVDNIGNIYSNLGNYSRALKNFKYALEICKSLGDKNGESRELANFGGIYEVFGDYNKALKCYKDSLQIARAAKLTEKEFYVSIALGDLYVKLNNKTEAKKLHDNAYKIADNLSSKRMLGDVLCSLCMVCLVEKKFEKFEKKMSMLKDLPEQLKSKKLEGRVSVLLGRYYSETQNFKKADRHFREALKIFDETKEKLRSGEVYYYMGKMALLMGEKSICKKHLQKSLDIFNSLKAKIWQEEVRKVLN